MYYKMKIAFKNKGHYSQLTTPSEIAFCIVSIHPLYCIHEVGIIYNNLSVSATWLFPDSEKLWQVKVHIFRYLHNRIPGAECCCCGCYLHHTTQISSKDRDWTVHYCVWRSTGYSLIRGRSHITSALFGVSGHPWWCCKPWSAFALTLGTFHWWRKLWMTLKSEVETTQQFFSTHFIPIFLHIVICNPWIFF